MAADWLPNLSYIVLMTSLAQFLFKVLHIVVLILGFWDYYFDKFQNPSTRTDTVEEYDFIIVGGGSAGSVLVNRMVKYGYHILLLEAGGNPNTMSNVPSYVPALMHSPPVDYDFYTVPQTNACLALQNNKSYWPRGKGLGGSSNLNLMFYQRGNKNDYDRWAELSGSKEWKFESIVTNFKNVENYHGAFYDERWHGNNSEGVYVSTSNEHRLVPEFLEAGREMGFETSDVNGLQKASFSPLDVSIKDSCRHSAYYAFLKPVINRDNLKIYRYARVIQIKVDETNRAYGLTYIRHGVERFVKTKKEIILSAGAIDTPKILMLSGIGPREHLEELGIKPILNLPVGQNLQDHTMAISLFRVDTPDVTFNVGRDFVAETISYFFKGTGPFSSPVSANAVAYIYSDQQSSTNLAEEATSPDIQLLQMSVAPSIHSTLENFLSLKKGFLATYLENSNFTDGFLINVMLGKPKSRGEIRLNSSDPMDRPILDPKYFSHPNDVIAMVKGINFTVTMVESTKAFRKHNASFIFGKMPGCDHHPPKSFQFYECYVRHITLTVYHQCGTCTMGKGADDPKAVVDSEFRVLGTKGLRVVDASIIPEIPNSNLNAVVYMLADKGSEIILNDWRSR